jgi:hypothetical protein
LQGHDYGKSLTNQLHDVAFLTTMFAVLGVGPKEHSSRLGSGGHLGQRQSQEYSDLVHYHRRALLEYFPGSLQQDFLESELSYIAKVLEKDSKNYHAWSLVDNGLSKRSMTNKEVVWVQEMEFGRFYY